MKENKLYIQVKLKIEEKKYIKKVREKKVISTTTP